MIHAVGIGRRWLVVSMAVTIAGAAVGLGSERPASAAPAPAWVRWVHQLGSVAYDSAQGVAVDRAGNVYVTGTTGATLPGSPDANAGGQDAFVASWDRAGNRRWVRQLGSAGFDRGFSVAVDAAGNVYVTGLTTGTLPGSSKPATGRYYAFIVSYDSAGNRRWGANQLGDGTSDAVGAGVGVDGAGNVYVTGYTNGTLPRAVEPSAGGYDVFVASWNGAGQRRWVHQLGSVPDIDCGSGDDLGRSVALDAAGNVYVTGSTRGTLPGSPVAYRGNCDTSDGFVASWDNAGNRRWVNQLGAGDHAGGFGVAVDGLSNVYVAGFTNWWLPGAPEPFAGGWTDAFVASWDSTGAPRWVHLLGVDSPTSGEGDSGRGVAVNAAGNVYVTGSTDGTLPGSPEPFAGGATDVFVASYDAGGTRRWVHQLGSTRDEEGFGVVVDRADNIYVAGETSGKLPKSREARAGDFDSFVARLRIDG